MSPQLDGITHYAEEFFTLEDMWRLTNALETFVFDFKIILTYFNVLMYKVYIMTIIDIQP